MSIRAQIAHRTRGRVRLQLAEHRGDREFFDYVSRLIAETGLVQAVRANPVTGSIVLEFDGDAEELQARLAAAVGLDIVAAPSIRQLPSPLGAVGKPFKLVSDREINPMLMAGTLFAAVGVVQTVRGRVLLPALSAFWYAVNAFRAARMQTKGGVAPD